MVSLLVSFAVYYLILFAVCFFVVGQGHDTLYDEPMAGTGWKVAVGSLLLAVMLTWTHSSFATMFTDDIGKTAFQGILWFGVFVLIFRFHPWHGVGIGLATMMIVSGLATMGVDSMMSRTPSDRFETQSITTPVRRPAYGTPVPKAAPVPTPAPK